jgi:hypothetical protein
MKKIGIIFGISSLLLGLSACSSNNLMYEDCVIFEDDDETVRLEIAFSTSHGKGRLTVLEDEVFSSFVVEYNYSQDRMRIYTDFEEGNETYYAQTVTFESISFWRTDYDIMYLNDVGYRSDTPHKILTGFYAKLTRNYTTEMSPLNYFYNRWVSEEAKLVFTNDNLMMYDKHSIKGTFNEDEVTISFFVDSFTILDSDKTIILSGTYFFEGKDIILEKLNSYEDFHDRITLAFKE